MRKPALLVIETNRFSRWVNLRGAYVAAMFLSTPLVPAAETPPTIQWQASFGGNRFEMCRRVVPAGDGGFVLGGSSGSGVSGNRTSANYGFGDLWLVKVDANGNKLWERSFGGSDDEGFYYSALAVAQDGGFLLGGDSYSDVSGNKTSPNYGNADFWLVKVDAFGNKLWDKSFGGSDGDFLNIVVPTDDSGFLLGGASTSGVSGNKTSDNYGSSDLWLVKVDANGNQLWDQSFGGSGEEGNYGRFLPWNVVPSGDGGFLIGAPSASGVSGNKTSPNYGDFDYWLVKIDPNGNKLWDRSFGGNKSDLLTSIAPTPDGGFLLGGRSESGISGNKSTPNNSAPNSGLGDCWLVKVDAGGNKLWEKTFGGIGDEDLRSIAVTGDGKILLGGLRSCYLQECGGPDFWLVKVDANGTKLWEQSFGGSGASSASGTDFLTTVLSTEDGGILLGGGSNSGISGSKTSPNYGLMDFWVIKLADPPGLFIEHDSGNARISWPRSAASYLLERTTALALPPATTTWSEVSPPYQTNATEISVTVPTPGGNNFFRLRKP